MATPQLVLLHGFLGDSTDWTPLIQALPDIQCHALTLPGHGNLAHQTQASIPRLPEFSRWLQQEIRARQLTDYHLLGYSLGGRLAMQFAASSPDGLRSLMIENAHPGLTTIDARHQRQQQDARWARRFYREPLPDVLADWYRQPVFEDLDAEARHQVIQARAGNQGPSLAAMMCRCSLARQPDYRCWIKATNLSFLYLCGQNDLKFQHIATQLAEPNPQITLRQLPGGHNLHRAQPDLMAKIIRDWIHSSTLLK